MCECYCECYSNCECACLYHEEKEKKEEEDANTQDNLLFQILDGLGLGPNGPPIPPPATFAVVPYPVRRHSPFASDTPLHYIFVASGRNDPNVAVESKAKKSELEIEKSDSRTEKVSDIKMLEHTKRTFLILFVGMTTY